MRFQFAPGDTSKSIDVFLPDSSSTTGAGLSGLVFNTASLAAYYRNTATGTVTAITLATQTVGGAWSSGGFVELDATHAKGMYRLDLPNAVLTSAGEGFVHIYGATNLAQTPVQISVGYQAVNVAQINAVSTSSVTAVNANQGTTQPINFHGTAGSAYVKSDVTEWLDGTIPAVNVTGVPKVDLVDWLGTAPLALTSQQVQAVVPNTQKVDVDTIKTQTITAAAGITFGVYVGGTGAAALASVWTTTVANHIDADISSRLATSGYTTPPTAVQNRQEMDSNSTGLAAIYGKVDTEVGTLQTTLDALVITVGVAGLGLSAVPKTGYKLASDGLDSVAVTAPAGVAGNFREMIVQLWRRFFKKSTLTATQLKTYADDTTTVLTTQTVSDDNTTQTQGASS